MATFLRAGGRGGGGGGRWGRVRCPSRSEFFEKLSEVN